MPLNELDINQSHIDVYVKNAPVIVAKGFYVKNAPVIVAKGYC